MDSFYCNWTFSEELDLRDNWVDYFVKCCNKSKVFYNINVDIERIKNLILNRTSLDQPYTAFFNGRMRYMTCHK